MISLSDQMGYLYRGDTLVAATTISSGRATSRRPTGIFAVLQQDADVPLKKYDNAAMPFAQFFDPAGLPFMRAMSAIRPNSHGCVHLPMSFAKKLYSMTPWDADLHRCLTPPPSLSRRAATCGPATPRPRINHAGRNRRRIVRELSIIF